MSRLAPPTVAARRSTVVRRASTASKMLFCSPSSRARRRAGATRERASARQDDTANIERRRMATDVIMPQMGESIAEGTITKWMKKVGDTVKRDEPIFEISTDKVDAEIPSPVAGTLTEI